MKSGSRSNALLVEILIVVAFFMLSATFLMQMFSAARMENERADLLTHALTEAQNIAERLYAAPDAEQALSDMGFVLQDDVWQLQQENYVAQVESSEEAMDSGSMTRQQVRILLNGEELVNLPVARYRSSQP